MIDYTIIKPVEYIFVNYQTLDIIVIYTNYIIYSNFILIFYMNILTFIKSTVVIK